MPWRHIDIGGDAVRIITDDEDDVDMCVGEYMSMYGITDRCVRYVNWGTIDGYKFADVEFYTPRWMNRPDR